jgi:hypothetical protein
MRIRDNYRKLWKAMTNALFKEEWGGQRAGSNGGCGWQLG